MSADTSWSPRENHWMLAVLLSAAAVVLWTTGAAEFKESPVLREAMFAIAGGLFAVATVEIVHVWFVARKVQQEFALLRDLVENGIQRVCTRTEATELGAAELARSRSLKVVGVSLGWLDDPAVSSRLEALLIERCRIDILLPDPLAPAILERYNRDEPPEWTRGPASIAELLIRLGNKRARHSSLGVFIYDRYPVATVTVYDNLVFVSPVLFRRRGVDAPTAIYRRRSLGGEIFEKHFDALKSESKEATSDYLNHLRSQLPNLLSKFPGELIPNVEKSEEHGEIGEVKISSIS